MSIKLMSQVWEVQSLTQPRKMLLLAVADFSNDEGLSWPSVETLMRKCSFKSDSGVRRALSELCDDGWLSKSSRSGKAPNGRRVQSSNYYQISLGRLLSASSEPAQRAASKGNPEPVHSEGSQHEPSHGKGSPYEGSCATKNTDYEPVQGAPDPLVNSKQDPSDNKTLCQPAAQTDAEVEITDQAKQVLNYLNQTTGSRYQVSKSSLDNIRARLREGFTAEEQQLTVDYMHAKWGGDLDMAEYLRPSTLFQPSKFPGYLEGANAWNRADRPARKNGKWEREGDVAVDTGERDAAYRRFISGVAATKAPSALEKIVCTEASKASVRGMRSDFAITAWNRIWKECAQRQQGVKAA